MSLEKQLQRAISQKLSAIPKIPTPNNIEKIVKREMSSFEAEGNREHLKTIRPTSVESERAFSSAGQICIKIRLRLNNDTLDALYFLRAHFQNS